MLSVFHARVCVWVCAGARANAKRMCSMSLEFWFFSQIHLSLREFIKWYCHNNSDDGCRLYRFFLLLRREMWTSYHCFDGIRSNWALHITSCSWQQFGLIPAERENLRFNFGMEVASSLDLSSTANSWAKHHHLLLLYYIHIAIARTPSADTKRERKKRKQKVERWNIRTSIGESERWRDTWDVVCFCVCARERRRKVKMQ